MTSSYIMLTLTCGPKHNKSTTTVSTCLFNTFLLMADSKCSNARSLLTLDLNYSKYTQSESCYMILISTQTNGAVVHDITVLTSIRLVWNSSSKNISTTLNQYSVLADSTKMATNHSSYLLWFLFPMTQILLSGYNKSNI